MFHHASTGRWFQIYSQVFIYGLPWSSLSTSRNCSPRIQKYLSLWGFTIVLYFLPSCFIRCLYFFVHLQLIERVTLILTILIQKIVLWSCINKAALKPRSSMKPSSLCSFISFSWIVWESWSKTTSTWHSYLCSFSQRPSIKSSSIHISRSMSSSTWYWRRSLIAK